MLLSRELLQTVEQIAVLAGQQILEVYHRPGVPEVSNKTDNSPLTEADLRAHQTIVEELVRISPGLPILSEEDADISFEKRRQWSEYWLVDPLDGTKEFISGNGEFTVNIALIRNGQPVLGVVHVPVLACTYLGIIEGTLQSAWYSTVGAEWRRLRVMGLPAPGQWHEHVLKVVASRRHGAGELENLLARWRKKFAGMELVNMGSSLKICLIAEGRADIYPRFAPTSEWDTAAAHAVLKAAGGDIVDTSLLPLLYNQKESLLNPSFFAIADPSGSMEGLLHESEFAENQN
ncbi:MAG: 3'(2'),5'-bisphosphate nucleotidase CysQ [Pseudohongiella sp.]|nr:3'(2'),5'-bisphosphate nucleotidase CysQ [Pseudohongiella sp.]MDO9520491.1 3'(2'),5'-bisphosphate nucleotidase CysQ [Pseudohongiella sp.]